MNVLMIYPQYPNTFWSFKKALKFISKKAAFPPLGLLTIASMLPENWNKKVVDNNVNRLKDKEIEWADLVFVSAMIVQKDDAKEIIQRCKNKQKTVVAGGPLFTVEKEAFEDLVDHFVLNEAENSLPQFLNDLAQGKAEKVYISEQKPDITQTPVPDWSLINPKDYAAMALQYSRGCPFNCEFCDIIVMNGRIPRTKTTEQFVAEFESLYQSGWRGGLFVVDDNFIGNKSKVKQLLPELIKWQKNRGYPFQLITEASTNLADDKQLMQQMSAANFYKVFLGIETPDENSLKECGKYQNTSRDLGDSVRIIQRHGMQVMGGFIVGFDNDTESIFETQFKFIQQVGIVTAMVGLLNALPQTRLWSRLKAEDRLLSHTSGENTDGKVNFIPKMGREQLLRGYHELLTQVYSRRMYYKRINTFIHNYVPTVKSRITPAEIKALLKSMIRIGIFSRSCFLYWKLLLKTLLINRKAFPEVVELAICGLHFEKVAKRI